MPGGPGGGRGGHGGGGMGHRPPPPPHRRGCMGCGCLPMVISAVAMISVLMYFVI